MNILRRLKKLELEIIDDSPTCRCNGDQPQIETRIENVFYDTYETGVYIPYQDRPNQDKPSRAAIEEPAEICLKCKKPVNKRIITIQLIGAEE